LVVFTQKRPVIKLIAGEAIGMAQNVERGSDAEKRRPGTQAENYLAVHG
jgi:hypothetical protein